MGKIKQINIKNQTYYLYNDIMMIKDTKSQFKKGTSDNVWYLIISGDADILRKFANIWETLGAKIEENTGGIVQYGKDYMRIKFESNDNLPIDKIVNIGLATIIIRSVFAQNGKFYPQLFLDDALHNI